jgi:hypothetical protein
MVADFAPGVIRVCALRFEVKLLQRLVEFADDLFFGYADVALQALNHRAGSSSDRISQLGLAASGRPLDQQWLPHAHGQIHHFQSDRINDVSRSAKFASEFIRR